MKKPDYKKQLKKKYLYKPKAEIAIILGYDLLFLMGAIIVLVLNPLIYFDIIMMLSTGTTVFCLGAIVISLIPLTTNIKEYKEKYSMYESELKELELSLIEKEIKNSEIISDALSLKTNKKPEQSQFINKQNPNNPVDKNDINFLSEISESTPTQEKSKVLTLLPQKNNCNLKK